VCVRLQIELSKERDRVIEYSTKEAVLTATWSNQSEQDIVKMKRLDAQILTLREEIQAITTKCQQVEQSNEQGQQEVLEAQLSVESWRARGGVAEEALSAARAAVLELERRLASAQETLATEIQQRIALTLRNEE
jgi:hypothetical protein